MSGYSDIIAALNAKNSATLAQPLTTTNVSLGTMESINTAISSYNTRAPLTPTVDGGFTGGGAYVAWRRIDFGTLFKGIPISIKDSVSTTVAGLIPRLNEMYGYTIGTDDVVNNLLPSPAAGQSAVVTITASSTSNKFVGSFTITYRKS